MKVPDRLFFYINQSDKPVLQKHLFVMTGTDSDFGFAYFLVP